GPHGDAVRHRTDHSPPSRAPGAGGHARKGPGGRPDAGIRGGAPRDPCPFLRRPGRPHRGGSSPDGRGDRTADQGAVEGPWLHRGRGGEATLDRKSTRLNSSHLGKSYADFCLNKKKIPASCIYIHTIILSLSADNCYRLCGSILSS